jgi:hypothetical protein
MKCCLLRTGRRFTLGKASCFVAEFPVQTNRIILCTGLWSGMTGTHLTVDTLPSFGRWEPTGKVASRRKPFWWDSAIKLRRAASGHWARARLGVQWRLGPPGSPNQDFGPQQQSSCLFIALISTIFFVIIKFCIVPAECICVLRMVLTINSDCFPKKKLTGLLLFLYLYL